VPTRNQKSKPPVFPPHAAAALFIERQHLTRPLQLKLGARTLERFVSDAGGLQIDSINVLDRAHYLTAWSRFGAYDRAKLDALIYKKRVLFEYWAHAACFVPASDLKAWRRAMLDYRTHHTGWSRFLRKHESMVAGLEAAIRERGPLGNADFARPKPNSKPGWWSWRPSTQALHYMWMSGRTGVHSRRHFQKRFDLMERVLPQFATIETLERDAFAHWHVAKSLHAMGAATERDLHWYLTFPRTKATKRRQTIAKVLRSGDAREIAIEGSSARWIALERDLEALTRAANRPAGTPPSRGTALLAPFDSFLWYRDRTSRLFDFDYTIEVYVPGHKRVHGYYSLPILHDGRLIGRLDAKTHRDQRWLEVRHVHFETWFAKGTAAPIPHWGDVARDAALTGIARALRSLAAFVGADRVTIVRTTPAKLRAPLARALKAAPAEITRAAPEAEAADDPLESEAVS
jgi:uncharacterized protein